MPAWKSIAREPLVHFVAFGAVIFAIDAIDAIDAWRGGDSDERDAVATTAIAAPTKPEPPAPATSSSKQIVVDPAQRERSRLDAERRLGRAPTPAESDAELQRWIDEEILLREALSRGLDRDDPMIRQRIASRMSFVLEQSIVVPEPSDAELRAYFDQHRDRWAAAERVDFTHVFVAGNDPASAAKADELHRMLASGRSPDGLGDTFTGGRRYRGRKPADLALAFGDAFVDGLAKQPIGTWVRRTSKHGEHVVRVDRVAAGSGADFDAARLDVRKQWVEERRAAELGKAVAKLRASWDVRR